MSDNWISTVSGKKIDYLAPEVSEICIEDIAAGLSHVPRFAGQAEYHYSVAQHSILCSVLCPSHPLEALLHDASEAFTGDLPTPLKRLLPEFCEIEDRLMATIFARFGCEYPLPPAVKRVDGRVLFNERDWLQPRHAEWVLIGEPYKRLALGECLVPEVAAQRFLDRFTELTEDVCS